MSEVIVATTNFARKPDVFDKFANKIQAKINEVKASYRKSQFEKELRGIVNLANVHKSKGVELGDPIYVELYESACSCVARYSGTDTSLLQSILVTSPALLELKRWAEYDRQAENIKKAKIVLAGIVISPILIGIVCGLTAGITHITSHSLTFWIH